MIQTKKSFEIYTELVADLSAMGGTPCENAPDMFFLELADPLGYEKVRGSKALCAGCPIRVKCLEYALEANEVHGVWGGLTPNERKCLKKGKM